MEIHGNHGNHGTKTCARSTKYCSNSPPIFLNDLEIAKFPRKYDILNRRTDTNRDLTLHSSEQKTGSSELWNLMTSRIVCCLATLGSNDYGIFDKN